MSPCMSLEQLNHIQLFFCANVITYIIALKGDNLAGGGGGALEPITPVNGILMDYLYLYSNSIYEYMRSLERIFALDRK